MTFLLKGIHVKVSRTIEQWGKIAVHSFACINAFFSFSGAFLVQMKSVCIILGNSCGSFQKLWMKQSENSWM